MEPLAPEDLVEEWSDLSAGSLGPGAHLGRYELLIPIAYGGMARVWAARLLGQRGFSKIVAIKTILPHLAENEEFERMFLDEARIASGVHHPNVTEIYELGEEGHVLYLAMEWVNGDSMVHVLRGLNGKTVQAVDPRVAARIVADACAGLHAAHELTDDEGRLLNVVHRDVSPHNILISAEGTVKVTDFGVAKAYGQMHQATVAGQIKGKIAYMAPEQIGGAAFDRRSDVFAIGCLLYEATTGQQPFRGANDPLVMQAVLKGTYDPPAKLVKGYAPELAAIVDRALAPEPRMRFATAERMRVALEEWLAKSGTVVTATQVGSLVRQRLGPQLDQRREHIKSATASLQGSDSGVKGNVRPAAGGGPQSGQSQGGQSHSGQSHSGVMQAAMPPPPPPMRGRMPSVPNAPPLPDMRGRAASVPSAPQPPPAAGGAMSGAQPAGAAGAPLPIIRSIPPSGAKYAVAAIAGVSAAMVLGGVALALWLMLRPHAPEPARPTAPAQTTEPAHPHPAATAAPAQPPSGVSSVAVPAPAPAAPAASAPKAVASAAAAVSAPSPAPSPTTVNVADLPPAKPAWTPPPPAPAPQPAAFPPAPAPRQAPKPTALPSNPY